MEVTPQDLRKWNTTYLSQHPEEKVRAVRGTATGNTDSVFDEHYDLARKMTIVNALMACHELHENKDSDVFWSEDLDARRRSDQKAIERANEAVLLQASGVDLTSKVRPVHKHLRGQFRQHLELLLPGHASRAGTRGNKERGLSEWNWVEQVIGILGREDAESLHHMIKEQYRGDENPSKRQWSGMCSHLEARKQRGGEHKNCPLVFTLKLFYKSLMSSNKTSSNNQQNCSDTDSSS